MQILIARSHKYNCYSSKSRIIRLENKLSMRFSIYNRRLKKHMETCRNLKISKRLTDLKMSVPKKRTIKQVKDRSIPINTIVITQSLIKESGKSFVYHFAKPLVKPKVKRAPYPSFGINTGLSAQQKATAQPRRNSIERRRKQLKTVTSQIGPHQKRMLKP